MDWLRGVFEFLLPSSGGLSIVRAFFGFILVFFLPGFAWTLVFFKKLHLIERVVLSFGMSIAMVTLSLILFNVLFGIRITGFNAVLIIIMVTILPVAIYYLNRLVIGRSSRS